MVSVSSAPAAPASSLGTETSSEEEELMLSRPHPSSIHKHLQTFEGRGAASLSCDDGYSWPHCNMCCVACFPSQLSFFFFSFEKWHMHLAVPQTYQQLFLTVPIVQFLPGAIIAVPTLTTTWEKQESGVKGMHASLSPGCLSCLRTRAGIVSGRSSQKIVKGMYRGQKLGWSPAVPYAKA